MGGSMSTIDGRNLVEQALLAAVSGDLDGLRDLVTDDVVAWSPTGYARGIDELAAELSDREGMFSEVAIIADPVDVIGDKVIAEWTIAARHTGPIVVDEYEIEATDIDIELRGVMILELRGGKIAKVRQYWNEVDLIEQLGLLPAE